MRTTEIKGEPKEAFSQKEIEALVRDRFGYIAPSTAFFTILALINKGLIGSERGSRKPGTTNEYTMVFFLQNAA